MLNVIRFSVTSDLALLRASVQPVELFFSYSLEGSPSDKDELSSTSMKIIAKICFNWILIVVYKHSFPARQNLAPVSFTVSPLSHLFLNTFLLSLIPYTCVISKKCLSPEAQIHYDDKFHFKWYCITMGINILLWKSLTPAFYQNCAGLSFRKTQGTLVTEGKKLGWISWAAGKSECWDPLFSLLNRPSLFSLLLWYKDLLLNSGDGVCKLSGSKV